MGSISIPSVLRKESGHLVSREGLAIDPESVGKTKSAIILGANKLPQEVNSELRCFLNLRVKPGLEKDSSNEACIGGEDGISSNKTSHLTAGSSADQSESSSPPLIS